MNPYESYKQASGTIDLRYSPLYGGHRVPTFLDKVYHFGGDAAAAMKHEPAVAASRGLHAGSGLLAGAAAVLGAHQLYTHMKAPAPTAIENAMHHVGGAIANVGHLANKPGVMAAAAVGGLGLAGLGGAALYNHAQKEASAYESYLLEKEAGFMGRLRSAMPHVQEAFNTADGYLQHGLGVAHGALDSVQGHIDAGREGLHIFDDVRAKAPILAGQSPKMQMRGAHPAPDDNGALYAIGGAGLATGAVLGGQHLYNQYQQQNQGY